MRESLQAPMTSVAPEILVNFVAAVFLCMSNQGSITEGQAVAGMSRQLTELGITSAQIKNYSAKKITSIIYESGGCVKMLHDLPELPKIDK